MALDQRQQTDIELLEDELHREQYEAAQLYVANSITDNCLSALKHETMYYPSRIQQLVETASLVHLEQILLLLTLTTQMQLRV